MVRRHPKLRLPLNVSAGTPFVQVLDPAAGAGVFLVEVIKQIHRTMIARWRAEGRTESQIRRLWKSYAPGRLLPRLHGFELLPAAYAVALRNVEAALADTGYRVRDDDQIDLCLGNALGAREAMTKREGRLSPAFMREHLRAKRLREATSITVVLGNPPYAINTANLSAAARQLVERYRTVDGARVKERGALKAEVILQDDYVKFLALAQRYIERSERGLVGFVTNSNYLLNPTLRGVRHSLLETFDRLYLLDLGGEAKHGRRGDENLFPIHTGVALSLLGRTFTDNRAVYAGSRKGS